MYKQDIRTIGIDDGPFTFRNTNTVVVGVVVRGKSYVEGVLKGRAAVDGNDATEALRRMINGSRFADQIRIVMLDGISLGGFNVIDMDDLSETTGKPVISVTRDPPDNEKVRKALIKNFDDWERRLELIERHRLVEVRTEYKPIYIKFCGMNEKDALAVVKDSIIRGCIPEQIRLAHMIASAFVLGDSRGSA